MATIKELSSKIASLKNTRKITKAMKMIATTKFRRAQKAVENSQPFAKGMKSMLTNVLSAIDLSESTNPLLAIREEVKKVQVMLFTSDRGLCGPFNANVIKETAKLIHTKREAGAQVFLCVAGKKGNDFFSKRIGVNHFYPETLKDDPMVQAKLISNDLIKTFLTEEADEIYLTFNEFKSAVSQRPTVQCLFPLAPQGEQVKGAGDVLFEPGVAELADKLIRQTVSFTLYSALLNSLASEHASRMTAMDSATHNAGDLIDKYTLLKNRARQAAITTELTEIISGAESLKG